MEKDRIFSFYNPGFYFLKVVETNDKFQQVYKVTWICSMKYAK